MKESSIVRRKSKIEGQGVFAIANIRKGARIVEYRGERKPFNLYSADSESYVNLFHVGRGLIIDPTRGGNIARFINHSCAPNCESIDDHGRIYIEAIRSIKKGEELTYDYHLDVGGRPTPADRKRYACRCGSENCRGTMYDAKKPRKNKAGKKTG
jgi:SET domain-containing protein